MRVDVALMILGLLRFKQTLFCPNLLSSLKSHFAKVVPSPASCKKKDLHLSKLIGV